MTFTLDMLKNGALFIGGMIVVIAIGYVVVVKVMFPDSPPPANVRDVEGSGD